MSAAAKSESEDMLMQCCASCGIAGVDDIKLKDCDGCFYKLSPRPPQDSVELEGMDEIVSMNGRLMLRFYSYLSFYLTSNFVCI